MPASSMPGEGVRGRGGADRVDRDLDVAVGAVLEADRHREAGAELAVGLALGGARADRAPGDRVGDVLRRDRVEELAADRQPELDHLEQQLAGDPQAGVDVAGAVQVRVVDQALPAGRRPRLLEVDAHHDQQSSLQLARPRAQPAGVVERRLRVVDAARDRPRPSAAGPCRAGRRRLLRAPWMTALACSSPSGSSSSSCSGGASSTTFAIRWSLTPSRLAPSHPDEHFAFAFLQTAEIVLSGCSLPYLRRREPSPYWNRRPAEECELGRHECRQAGRLAKSPAIGEAARRRAAAPGARWPLMRMWPRASPCATLYHALGD